MPTCETCPQLCKHTPIWCKHAPAAAAGLIAALRGLKVSEEDGDGASGEGEGLRGDQRCVIPSAVYFFSASALLPSSPPHHLDQYSEAWRTNVRSRSALTELGARG